jgi:ubiquinone/menaquinone biosynthesis C-methylase UbiE
MSNETTTCFDERRTYGQVRTWNDDPLTTRARAIWSAGDALPIAKSYAIGAEQFVNRLAIRPGESVLDVGCGAGTLAIQVARAGGRVSGIDIAPYVIAEARLEARAAGCNIEFDVGDAESLPFVDHQFDTTVTMFGAMFAFRPERAAAELVRVTRPGGRVVMANWTPEGFAGQFRLVHTSLMPPLADAPSPLDWGREEEVRARLGDAVSSVTFTRRTMELRFPAPPAAVTELFANCFAPTVTALRELDAEHANRLRSEMTRLFQLHNRATNGTTTLAAEFLDVQARVA